MSAQCLYFHLNMRADDDGFIGNPKRIMRTVGARDDDMRILISKRFVLTFDNGVIVIKHWRMHNCISQNRYHETQYTDEKRTLLLKDNKSYSTTHGVPLDDSKMIEAQISAPVMIEDQETSAERPKRNDYPDDFEAFWAEYPKKADKGMAYKKYQARIKSGFSPEELRLAARNYRMECERMVGVINQAMKGNTKAAAFLRDTVGENPAHELRERELDQKVAEFEYHRQQEEAQRKESESASSLADVIEEAYRNRMEAEKDAE